MTWKEHSLPTPELARTISFKRRYISWTTTAHQVSWARSLLFNMSDSAMLAAAKLLEPLAERVGHLEACDAGLLLGLPVMLLILSSSLTATAEPKATRCSWTSIYSWKEYILPRCSIRCMLDAAIFVFLVHWQAFDLHHTASPKQKPTSSDASNGNTSPFCG